jgi:hypothetical protein
VELGRLCLEPIAGVAAGVRGRAGVAPGDGQRERQQGTAEHGRANTSDGHQAPRKVKKILGPI